MALNRAKYRHVPLPALPYLVDLCWSSHDLSRIILTPSLTRRQNAEGSTPCQPQPSALGDSSGDGQRYRTCARARQPDG